MRIVDLDNLYSGMIIGRDINYKDSMLFPRYTVLTNSKIKEILSLRQNNEIGDCVWVLDLSELKPVILRENYITYYYIDFIVSLMRQVFSAALTGNIDFNRLAFMIRSCLLNNRQLLYETIILRNNHCYTFEHSMNVALYSLLIGLKMELSTDELRDLLIGSLLHDIGKINISNDILNKSSSLTSNEFQAIKQHPNYGVDLTESIDCVSSRVSDIICQHHEKLDGSGYPYGFDTNSINHLSKIVTISDIFDAVISSRAYHERRPVKSGVDILHSDCEAGKIDKSGVDLLVSSLVLIPMNSIVLLSNEKTGIVVEDCNNMFPKVLMYEDNEIFDLDKRRDIQVAKVIK